MIVASRKMPQNDVRCKKWNRRGAKYIKIYRANLLAQNMIASLSFTGMSGSKKPNVKCLDRGVLLESWKQR